MTLLGDLQVDEDLAFQSASNLNTAAQTLTLDEDATVSTPAADRYIIADDVVGGSVIKKKDNTDDVTFPIGDATAYAPVQVTAINGTPGATATISASTAAVKAPNAPVEATDFINRYWDVQTIDVPGFEATLVGTYADADIEAGATEANISGAGHDGMDWSYAGSLGDAATNQVTVDVDYTSVEFTGTNKFGRVDLTNVYLQGAYSGGNNTTSLNSSGILEANALTSPYDASVSVASGFFAANTDITDWVEIEVRDATDPSIVISSHSAFLKNNGDVVGLDGTAAPLLLDAPSTGYIAINHRNHLTFRTGAALDLLNTTPTDLSDIANVYVNAALSNEAMKEVTAGVYAMWAGNANGNSNIRYSGPGNDLGVLLNVALGGNKSSVVTNVYSDADFNMNGTVRFSGPANDNGVLLNSTLAGNKSSVFTSHQ